MDIEKAREVLMGEVKYHKAKSNETSVMESGYLHLYRAEQLEEAIDALMEAIRQGEFAVTLLPQSTVRKQRDYLSLIGG